MNAARPTSWLPFGFLTAATLAVATWSLLDTRPTLDATHDALDELQCARAEMLQHAARLADGAASGFDALSHAEARIDALARGYESACCFVGEPTCHLTASLVGEVRRELDTIKEFKSDLAAFHAAVAGSLSLADEIIDRLTLESPAAAVELSYPIEELRLAGSSAMVGEVELQMALKELLTARVHEPALDELASRVRVGVGYAQAVRSAIHGMSSSGLPDRLRDRMDAVHELLDRRTLHFAWRQRVLLVLLLGAAVYGGVLVVQLRSHASALRSLNEGLEARIAERTAELEVERTLLGSMIASLPNAVFWKDEQNRYRGCNRAFAELVGLESPAAVAGLTDDDLSWDDATRLRKSAVELAVLRSGVPLAESELAETLATGVRHELIASKTPLLNSAGEVCGLVGVYTDVTDRNRLRGRLQQAEKLRSVGQLAAGVAHEINTPIQACAANMEFLREGVALLLDVAEECHREHNPEAVARGAEPSRLSAASLDRLRQHAPCAIDESAEAIRRVTEIVRAMRVLSHPGTSDKGSTDVNLLVGSAATLARSRWKHVAELTLELDPELPHVPALANELSQAVLNLIVNAADAVAERRGEAGPLGSIRVRTRRRAGGVAIDVEDDGAGMTPEVRRRIFEPFYTTKGVGMGTGQGLALAWDSVVNKHGGQIDCESRPGEGTRFVLWLPGDARVAEVTAGV